MNTDSHFTIGKSHKVNQDYASHGDNFVLVSDGCSSSKDTDFGSRLLVKTYQSLISGKYINRFATFFHALQRSRDLTGNLQIQQEALDATLLSLKVDNDKYYLKVSGDGFFVKVKTDGSIEYKSFYYPSGAPYYLNYCSIHNDREEKYKELYGTKFIIKTYSDGILTNQEEIEDCMISNFEESLQDIKYLSIMTDGVASFLKSDITETSKSNLPVSEYDVIKELVAYKNHNGEFVKRRMQAFAKHCHINNLENMDDFSVGTICL